MHRLDPQLNILISRYSLKMRYVDLRRSGFLLRLEDSDGHHGFADCHPWPELGDKDIEQQLEVLKSGLTTRLLERSIESAGLDLQARLDRRSLLGSAVIPSSHHLVFDLHSFGKRDFDEQGALGLHTFKIKLREASLREVEALNTLVSWFKNNTTDLILDCNGNFSIEVFSDFFASLSESTRAAIKFVEDPTPYDAGQWLKLVDQFGVKLARDRGSEDLEWEGAEVVVLKPAIQDCLPLAKLAQKKQKALVVTSYMGHPVEQLHAALVASQLRAAGCDLLTCGLLSHAVYEQENFKFQLQHNRGCLVPPPGDGIGWTDLLAEQTWRTI